MIKVMPRMKDNVDDGNNLSKREKERKLRGNEKLREVIKWR